MEFFKSTGSYFSAYQLCRKTLPDRSILMWGDVIELQMYDFIIRYAEPALEYLVDPMEFTLLADMANSERDRFKGTAKNT